MEEFFASALFVSAFGTAGMTAFLLPFLHRLKGETVREDLPERHKQKTGTPTMGGWAFSVTIPVAAFLFSPSVKTALMAGTMFSFALLGFADDWAKLRRGKGWRTQPKLAAQIFLATLWLTLAIKQGAPFAGTIWSFLFALLLLLATVNGVNIADGLDGLAAGLTAIASITVAFLAGQREAVIFAGAICGGCLGFLPFNRYPARVFMGDVGSMALGAGLGMAVLFGEVVVPFLIIGAIFWIEQVTVVLQVAYFKWTKRKWGEGRRIFPMTPIHHSFELWGWSEPKVVALFWFLGSLAAGAGWLFSFVRS